MSMTQLKHHGNVKCPSPDTFPLSTLLSIPTSCNFVERGDFPTIPTESILNTTKLFLYQLSTGVLHFVYLDPLSGSVTKIFYV